MRPEEERRKGETRLGERWRESEGMGPRIGKGGCVMGKREVGWDPRDQEGKGSGKTGNLETRKRWWMEMGCQEPGRGSRMNTRITDSES